MNPLLVIFLVIFGIVVLALYFLPTIVGANRRAPRFGTILLINLFFGWSLLPWIFAMWMAFRSDPVRPIGAMPQAPRLAQAGNSASNNAALNGRRCTKCGRTSSPEDPFFYICGVCQHGGDGTITRSLQGSAGRGTRYPSPAQSGGSTNNSTDGPNKTSSHPSPGKPDGVSLVCELYLLWLDNGDHDMPVDPFVRKHYTELARMHPACPIDEEAMAWLGVEVKSMTESEIRRAIELAAAKMGSNPMQFFETHEPNVRDIINYRNRAF